MYAFAHLDPDKLQSLREFEDAHGVRVLALSELEVAAANIDSQTLDDLKRLEEDLGVTLVAVRE